jgi:hypothetical protein
MESLTGRVEWWIAAWKKYTDAPFTGYGAYTAGRFLIMGSFGEQHCQYPQRLGRDSSRVRLLGYISSVIRIGRRLVVSLTIYVRRLANTGGATTLSRGHSVFTVVTFRTVFSTDLTWHCPLTFWLPMGYAEYLRRRYSQSRSLITAPAYM